MTEKKTYQVPNDASIVVWALHGCCVPSLVVIRKTHRYNFGKEIDGSYSTVIVVSR
jgi:hypothetical protein